MARSTSPVRAKRINAALELLNKRLTPAEAAKKLARAYGMSMRQAYRYLETARSQQQPLSIPEQKIPFTVKLSPSLITALRQHATDRQLSLGEVVQIAVTEYLRVEQQGGG